MTKIWTKGNEQKCRELKRKSQAKRIIAVKMSIYTKKRDLRNKIITKIQCMIKLKEVSTIQNKVSAIKVVGELKYNQMISPGGPMFN